MILLTNTQMRMGLRHRVWSTKVFRIGRSLLTQSAECTLIRLTFWQSCGDVGTWQWSWVPLYLCSRTWFVTNPALGIQAVIIPLSEDVKHWSKGRDLRRRWPHILANFRCLPIVGHHFLWAPVSSSVGRLTYWFLGQSSRKWPVPPQHQHVSCLISQLRFGGAGSSRLP
jgi:hypothetical protein